MEVMRYAIVTSGGKQYVAREGETLEVDRLGPPPERRALAPPPPRRKAEPEWLTRKAAARAATDETAGRSAWGSSATAARRCAPAPSWAANAAPRSTRDATLIAEATTRSSPPPA